MNEDDAVDRIEIFIKRLHDGEIFISEKANQIAYESTFSKKDSITFSDALGMALGRYESTKGLFLPHQRAIGETIEWINRAYSSGFVLPSNGNCFLIGCFC